MKKSTKIILKLNIVISLALSIYLAVKGSINHGWYTCMSFSQTFRCNLIKWLSQIGLLALIIFVALFIVIFGIKFLFAKRKREGKIWKGLTLKKAVEQSKEKKIEMSREKPEKKVIKI